MHVLVTGAAGYIGRHVVKELLEQGHDVTACDITFKGIDERANFCETDIFSHEDSIYKKTGCPDLLIHLAWKNGFVHNSPAHMENLSGHIVFLRNMAAQGCKKIAVMGTMHEIGYHEGAIDENTPCNPLSQYGIAKNALRQSMLLAGEELGFTLYWLRAYYIYGDDAHGSSIFAKITQAAGDGKKEFPFTTGENKYDFISVQNLAKLIIAASTQDKITGVINVCSGKPVSLAEQVEKYIKDNGFDIKLQYGVFPDRPYDSPAVWGDSEKIHKIMAGL